MKCGEKFMLLQGDKIRLVPIEKKHLDDIMKGWNNPVMRKFLNPFIPYSREIEIQWIDNAIGKIKELKSLTFVIEKNDGKFLGTCGTTEIDWISRSTEIGIAIHSPDEWGKGYGTEALELLIDYLWKALNLERLELSVYAFNERAISVYKKLGFVEWGRAHKKRYVEGKYEDVIYMELFKH